MTKHLLTSLAMFSALFAVPAAWAQATPPPEAPDVGPALTLERSPEKLNRIGLSYRMGLNITVDFKKLGGLALSDPGPVTGSAINRNYDNGYNRVDVTGNDHGGFIGTWNWGYQSANSAPGNDTLELQSYATLPNANSKNRTDDPQHGFEITYDRELYRNQTLRAGVEAGFGYTLIDISDSRALRATTYRTNDTFALGGVVPPLAPFAGTFEGPGPVIASSPTSRTLSVLTRTALITGSREVDADLFTLRLGPYVEIPLDEKFSFLLSGGLTLGIGHTEFSFHETVQISDPTFLNAPLRQTRSGSGSQTDFLVGGYIGGSLSYALTEELSLVAGAQFQAAGEAVNNARGKQSILNLGESVIVTVGAAYSF